MLQYLWKAASELDYEVGARVLRGTSFVVAVGNRRHDFLWRTFTWYYGNLSGNINW